MTCVMNNEHICTCDSMNELFFPDIDLCGQLGVKYEIKSYN